MTYVKNVDYPSNFENKYQNLVASGQRPTQRVYFQHPPNSGNWYELFYDVLLTGYNGAAPKNPFQYEFIYWVTKVKLSTRGGTSVPLGETKYLQTDYAPITGGSALTRLTIGSSSYTEPLPSNARFVRDTKIDGVSPLGLSAKQPRPFTPITQSEQTEPKDFGWRAKIRSATGIPGRGDGGAPYWDTQASKPGKPEEEDAPEDPGTLPGEDPEDTTPATDIGFTYPKKRDLKFNPPLISTASGAYVGVNVEGTYDGREPGTRGVVIGRGSNWQRFMRKGTIQQYIRNEEEWKVTGSNSVVTKYNKKGKAVEKDSWTAGDSVLDPKFKYGFRFHYNPSEISFSTQNIDGVDPSIIVSGLDKAMPVAADGASIGLTLYLNRIEDMSFLERDARGAWQQWRDLYAGKKVSSDDLKQLAERGTAYDLEFLFRAALGRPYRTALRGTTADLGVIVGLPLLLNLGGRMRFMGRLSSLQYTHTSFTQNMIPMFTSVNLTFSRVPDAAQFSQ